MKPNNNYMNNDDALKQLLIISGKGGTGKTTLNAAFTSLTRNAVVADCDVDAANLHIVLQPEIKHSYSNMGGKEATIDLKHCTECSLCAEYCRFDAIHNFQDDPLTCEGCGFCYRICPVNTSLTGADFAIIITKPTVSGLHDLKRLLQLIKRFCIPSAVVINKYDLNPGMTELIENFASEINIDIVGIIPFDENVDRALLSKKSILEYENSPAAREISNIWDRIDQLI